MPLKIIRQDITKIKCDAIINPSNEALFPGGGVDAAIHAAAGEQLFDACQKLGGVEIGGAKITPAFRLPCKYVIHTAGPIWCGGDHNEKALLESCYTECLKLAKKNKCKSVAFPLISSGLYSYPKDQVMRVAVNVISDFLFDNEMTVYIVVYDKTAYAISEKLFADVSAYVDDSYVDMNLPLFDSLREQKNYSVFERKKATEMTVEEDDDDFSDSFFYECDSDDILDSSGKLDEMLRSMDKGFAETLFYFIDKKGISDVECYKRANVDKKTFSKIKCNKNYKPSKITVVSFAIALRLDLEETEHLLNTVGMSLSRSNKFDVIIKYFITTGKYRDIFDVNETLYQFDQVTLGV